MPLIFSKKPKNFKKIKNYAHDSVRAPVKLQVKPEHGPSIKKKFGQHFLRKQSVIDRMIDLVTVTPEISILEIGCGDGVLTRALIDQTKAKNILVYEIDPEWAAFVKKNIKSERLQIVSEDILSIDFEKELTRYKPLVLLANLPYQITFPILFLIQKHKHLFTEGVVMVQEEVAQKIVAQSGRSYSPTSIFLQYHFDWRLIEKVEPEAFEPPPKVFSRTLYFKPKKHNEIIPEEILFWKFLKLCFRSPRQTLKNNLKGSVYFSLNILSEEILGLRGQQIPFSQFLNIWRTILSAQQAKQ